METAMDVALDFERKNRCYRNTNRYENLQMFIYLFFLKASLLFLFIYKKSFKRCIADDNIRDNNLSHMNQTITPKC